MSNPLPRPVESAPPRDAAQMGRLPRRLPAVGLPRERERRGGGVIVSILVHAALIAALLSPALALHTDSHLFDRAQGAGGLGPAGGGGGGNRGTGGIVPEHLTYVRAAPPAPAQPAITPPPVTPPPVVTPPKVEPPMPQPAAVEKPAAPEVKAVPTTATPAPTTGTGGGTGNDGSAGSGPGSGGGVGSGIGTGRGAGTGPGTGGGTQSVYPPTTIEVFLPPIPYPDRIHGFHLIAEYDVDSTGKILSWKFTPTPDRGYNRQLEQVLKAVRFRPAVRPDGSPVRWPAQITYDF